MRQAGKQNIKTHLCIPLIIYKNHPKVLFKITP